MRAALGNRRFAAYLIAAGSADAGYWVATVAQGWLVVKLTDAPLWLGVVAAASQLPFLLFSLAGGGLADRYERRRVIAANNVAMAVVAATTAALVATGHIGVASLVALGFVAGTLNALEHPVDRAWVYDLVGGRNLGTAIALSSLEWATARTVGPAVGGAAVALIGVAAGYGAYAVAVLPLAVLALASGPRGSAPASARPARSAAGQADADRAILAFCAFIAVFTIGISPYIALLPDIAKNGFGQGPQGYGAMAAAGGVGAIAGAVALSLRGEFRYRGRGATIAAGVGALLLVAFALCRSLALAFPLLVAMGAVDTLMYALANTYVQEIAGDDERGRANAIFSLAFLGGLPVGNALLGALAQRFGSAATLAGSAACVALAALVFWTCCPRARDAA